MKLLRYLAIFWFFLIAACGGGGGGGSSGGGASTYSLSGQFQKGPFAIGSQISVNQLDTHLNPTGSVYNVQTNDDLGHFSLATPLTGNLVELVGDGFYMDELTGQLSPARIQLRAIADLSSQASITVNILTSLQLSRLQYLVGQGMPYQNADAQSMHEVLLAFGINSNSITDLSSLYSMQIVGTSDQNAVLLALSAVLSQMATTTAATNGTSQPAELSNFVNTISAQLQSNGTISSSNITTAIHQAQAVLNLATVRANVTAYYASHGITATVPLFEEWIDKNGTGLLPQRLGASNDSATGALATARSGHTATLLSNGNVLLVGGQGDLISGARAPIGTSEIYNATTGVWTTTGNLAFARSGHSATMLNSGLVLVAGGTNGNGQTALASAELYNPALGTWTTTGAMNTSRWGHAAVLLQDGRVLVCGGDSNDSATASSEIYDPATGMWTAVGNMSARRMLHGASLLPSGRVIVFAGFGWPAGVSSAATAELFDPSTGTWSSTAAPSALRYSPSVTTLSSDQILVAGGYDQSNLMTNVVELFDTNTLTWSTTSNMAVSRAGHTATVLQSGRVLVVGGGANNGASPIGSAEVYDPISGLWTLESAMLSTPRGGHSATLLANGKVLISAGVINSGMAITTALAELYWQ